MIVRTDSPYRLGSFDRQTLPPATGTQKPNVEIGGFVWSAARRVTKRKLRSTGVNRRQLAVRGVASRWLRSTDFTRRGGFWASTSIRLLESLAQSQLRSPVETITPKRCKTGAFWCTPDRWFTCAK